MSPDINDLMIFLAVVESGSFTNAAERLGMPKANVSRRLSRLEHSLGVRLLERTTRSQKLTEAGRRYLLHCKRIEAELDLAQAAIGEELTSVRGRLKVGTSVSVGQQILRPHLGGFLGQYPELELQLNLTNQRVDLIEEGYDLVIRVGDLDDSRLVAKKLGCAQRKVYASPAYLSSQRGSIELDRLEEYQWLQMSNHNRIESFDLKNGKQVKTMNITPRLRVDDFAILKQSAVDGLGLAILPSYMCREELASGALIDVLPKWQASSVDLFALYPAHRSKIPKMRAFLDFASEIFADYLKP